MAGGTKNEREIKKPLNGDEAGAVAGGGGGGWTRLRIIEKAGDSGNLANQIFARYIRCVVRLKICNTMLPRVRILSSLLPFSIIILKRNKERERRKKNGEISKNSFASYPSIRFEERVTKRWWMRPIHVVFIFHARTDRIWPRYWANWIVGFIVRQSDRRPEQYRSARLHTR